MVFSDDVKSEIEENDVDDGDDIWLPVEPLDEADEEVDGDHGVPNHGNRTLVPAAAELPAQTSSQSAPSSPGSLDDDTELLMQNISSDEEFG